MSEILELMPCQEQACLKILNHSICIGLLSGCVKKKVEL